MGVKGEGGHAEFVVGIADSPDLNRREAAQPYTFTAAACCGVVEPLGCPWCRGEEGIHSVNEGEEGALSHAATPAMPLYCRHV